MGTPGSTAGCSAQRSQPGICAGRVKWAALGPSAPHPGVSVTPTRRPRNGLEHTVQASSCRMRKKETYGTLMRETPVKPCLRGSSRHRTRTSVRPRQAGAALCTKRREHGDPGGSRGQGAIPRRPEASVAERGHKNNPGSGMGVLGKDQENQAVWPTWFGTRLGDTRAGLHVPGRPHYGL